MATGFAAGWGTGLEADFFATAALAGFAARTAGFATGAEATTGLGTGTTTALGLNFPAGGITEGTGFGAGTLAAVLASIFETGGGVGDTTTAFAGVGGGATGAFVTATGFTGFNFDSTFGIGGAVGVVFGAATGGLDSTTLGEATGAGADLTGFAATEMEVGAAALGAGGTEAFTGAFATGAGACFCFAFGSGAGTATGFVGAGAAPILGDSFFADDGAGLEIGFAGVSIFLEIGVAGAGGTTGLEAATGFAGGGVTAGLSFAAGAFDGDAFTFAFSFGLNLLLGGGALPSGEEAEGDAAAGERDGPGLVGFFTGAKSETASPPRAMGFHVRSETGREEKNQNR